MPYVKIDRDTILDKIYECRSKIDFTNQEALKIISELVDIVIKSPEPESKATMPQIRVRRF